MRNGPKLLSWHLGMSGAALSGQAEATRALTEMVRGIQMYMNAAYMPQPSPRIEMWREGQTSLQRIIVESRADRKKDERGVLPVCVLVPSLINGSSILDLCAERSLAAWLAGQGLDVYLLDWGDLLREEAGITLDDLVAGRLAAAIRFLRQDIQENGNGGGGGNDGAVAGGANAGHARPVHGLGYCMGGALCLGAAHHDPDLFASLTLLATPWNFYAGQQRLLQHVRFWSPSALAVMASRNYLSADSLQALFAGLDPMLAQKKFARFSKMDMESVDARIFVAVEDWLNDGKDLPYKIAQECMIDWFLSNAPFSGNWAVAGRAVDLRALRIPLHIVASRKDQLVEFDAALGVRDHVPHAALTVPDCGHVGMIAGRNSVEEVWAPMAAWIKKYSGAEDAT